MQFSVHHQGHYFQDCHGEPFFWLADTCWLMLNKMSDQDISFYLKDRSQKGFNIIQTLVFRDLFEPNAPDIYGNRPLDNMEHIIINENWMQRLEFLIEEAQKLNIFIALLPSWGDKWSPDSNSAGPIIFDEHKAKNYGYFLAKRLKKHSNIIWMFGGDSPITSQKEANIISCMAKGIRAAVGANCLMTYHPNEYTYSELFHSMDWLDFHSFQSGHVLMNSPNWQIVERYFNDPFKKPIIDAEPCYEGCPIQLGAWGHAADFDFVFRDYDIRKAAYRSVFAGAAGITYGAESIRQVFKKGDIHHNITSAPLRPWYKSLDLPGSLQMQYLKELILSYPYFNRRPAQSLLRPFKEYKGTGRIYYGDHMLHNPNQDYATHIRVMSDFETYIMAYTPIVNNFQIRTHILQKDTLTIKWFNPQTGCIEYEKQQENNGIYRACSPYHFQDAVLIID